MRLCLFPTTQAPGEARQRMATFADSIDEGSLANVKTVVSEFVAISVTHGASQPIDMRIELLDGELEGVVDDHGPGARAIARARERRDDSLVLRIIDGLVDEWGPKPGKTEVWFRMPVRRLSASGDRPHTS